MARYITNATSLFYLTPPPPQKKKKQKKKKQQQQLANNENLIVEKYMMQGDMAVLTRVANTRW